MNHLRYSGLPTEEQNEIFTTIILGTSLLDDILHRVRDLSLPDCWIVSGALYNSIWNHLTERPPLHGIKDIDIAYFDATDLSWEVEDAIIEQVKSRFDGFPLPVEIRNQARVHLWFEERFRQPYAPLESAVESIPRYSTVAHCIGARLEQDGRLTLYAPFGLDDIFSFRLRPNRAIDNADTHRNKARRAREYWPELTFQDWDEPEKRSE